MKTRMIVLSAILLCMGVSRAAAVKEMAFVLKVTGDVKIKTAAADWVNLQKGGRICSGDRIRTGDDALVSLVFIDDKSMMKIRANSEVEITGDKNAKGISKQLMLQVGELWNKVTPGGAGYRVATPSGVAAVKGTEFYSLVDNQGQTFIFGIEGLVQLLNELGEVLVGKGQMGFSKKGEKPNTSPSINPPDWGIADGEQEMDIEFQNSAGDKKHLIIRFKKK